MEKETQKPTFTSEHTGKGEYEIYLSGSLNNQYIGPLWKDLHEFLEKKEPSYLLCDFRKVTDMDTAGMALIKRIESICTWRGIEITHENVPENVRKFLEHAEQRSTREEGEEKALRPGIVTRLGQWFAESLTAIHKRIEFIGKIIVACFIVLRHPKQFGFGNFMFHLQRVGAEAVPLVCALSALMGLVVVFQGMATTRRLGSEIYIADMVTISVTTQMAPLLTAIIVSGRSGAAFAAEIGSMKIRQELDVLSVMNLDIISFLVLPRVLAITIATPLLTILSDASGIVGGFLTSKIVMDLPFEAFFIEVRDVLQFTNLLTGVIKGVAFGLLIGISGCFYGLQTKNTTDSIGMQTTSAVVSGILLIVLANSAFAFLFSEIGW